MRVVPRFPLKLNASLALPTSKSLCARALVINHLCEQPVHLEGLSDCDDTQAILQGLEALRNSEDTPLRVDVGAAGTAMRFLTALFAATPQLDVLITGSQRMKERPIGALVTALQAAGADISYVEKEGYPPLRIRGKQLKGGKIALPSNISSQYVSALLMIAPTMRDGLHLELVGKVASAPYIRMTIQVMKAFGVEAKWENNLISIESGQRYVRTLSPRCGTTEETEQAASYAIESDWSAASYWYEIVALHPDKAARVLLRGLRETSEQGDSVCARWFEALGVTTTFTAEGAILEKSSISPQAQSKNDSSLSKGNTHSLQTDDNFSESNECLSKIDCRLSQATSNSSQAICHSSQTNHSSCKDATPLLLDFTAAPDLAQTFVVTCALLSRPFHFKGLESLRIKETDRIVALIAELQKLGKHIEAIGEGELRYTAQNDSSPTQPITIATYDDHRMALAFAPAALLFPQLSIEHPEVVAKSYPHYWEHLSELH
ncbi:3-phosphoshikimate 1-carboxyvinyltransferase [Alloprevotella sp. oral taxon 473]|uniref:3-phosphoshikimate 1-carboxyvinyltransferase n=1 Tax=Alloprevotella sp. oral taxon 473 TaxID=712469 RepID=UPI0002A3319D|nr:3-phosphoshikimate 1-carboxyvinyltransferase [Alloprevotella sp. oral taxon 473]EKX89693.1 putative 3-phosphoshikimate 1-carboxyvinyltransferase [Alloprevotella sp. oral taxon 473 str. F0040]